MFCVILKSNFIKHFESKPSCLDNKGEENSCRYSHTAVSITKLYQHFLDRLLPQLESIHEVWRSKFLGEGVTLKEFDARPFQN